MLPPKAHDPAFCAHPTAFDATLHLLGAAAQSAAGQPQPLRVPALIDGLICHASAAEDLFPVAMPAQSLADGVQCSYRMLGKQGPVLELGHLLAKEVQQPKPAASAEEAVDWHITYETQQQAVQAAQLAPGQPSALHVLAALPAPGSSGSLSKAQHSVEPAPAKSRTAVHMLASRSAGAVRLLAAGLHLTQQACRAAASTVAVLSRSGGTVQPGRTLHPTGPAGMAALLKVAAAEHPGTSFVAASCSISSTTSVQAAGARLIEVRGSACGSACSPGIYMMPHSESLVAPHQGT